MGDYARTAVGGAVAASLLYNETDLDIQRGNTDLTLLASAARTATTSSPDQTNINARGVIVWFNLTVVPGVDTVQVVIEGKDPVSGNYGALASYTAISTTIQPGRYVFYPGASGAGPTGVAGLPLPRIWRVRIVHSGAGSFTYSVGASLIL